MTLFKRYTLGFDFWGLLLFLLVMLPNIVWFAVPAPEDVLRTESVTPVIDAVASVLQILTVAGICFVVNKARGKLRFSPLVVATMGCIVFYYFGWVLYYAGVVGSGVILLLTLPPCAAFVLFAADRRNLPAVLAATGFSVCHLLFGIINFIL